MKYSTELTQKLVYEYRTNNKSVTELAALISDIAGEEVPERSIISKLVSEGVYKKKGYLTKRGEAPIKKEEYIERIAALLDVSAELLESLEKVNKNVLALLAQNLVAPVEQVNYFKPD